MIMITTHEIVMDDDLKNKLDIIFEFSSIKDAKFINGSFKKIELTNLTYVEPHIIIIESKNVTLLAFNYYNEVYINNLSIRIKISKLTDIINNTKDLCNGLLKFIDTLCFEDLYSPRKI